MAVGAAIQERQQQQRADNEPGNHDCRDRLEGPGKVLQQLEQAEEIPLGPRDVRRVRRIRNRVERNAHGQRERQQQGEHGRHRNRVLQRVVRVKRLWLSGALSHGPGNAVPPHQVDVRHNEGDQRRRQQEDVRRVPPEQCQGPEVRPSPHDRREVLTDDGGAPRHVDRDRRRPVGFLIPWQQVARQREAEDDQQQHDARDPGDLARLLVRAEQHNPQHVDYGGNDDEAGAEEVQAADDPAEGQLIADVADAVVRVLRRGHVVHREDDAGEELDGKEEEQDAAGDEPPAHTRGEGFVEQVRAAGPEAGAMVQPVEQRTEPPHQSCTSTCSPSTRVASVSSGEGGGPAVTAPVRSKTPPWQGHLRL